MNDPVSAREALLIEAIGEAAHLIESIRELTELVQQVGREFSHADAGLRDSLSTFESRVAAVTEYAKKQTSRYIAVQTDEATRRSIDQQSRAMADAARVAFGAQLGALMQRLQAMLQSQIESRRSRWVTVLTYLATAAGSSAATWAGILLAGRV